MICLTGKRPYANKAAAQASIKSANRRRNPRQQRRETRTYRCFICNAWHLTSQGVPRN